MAPSLLGIRIKELREQKGLTQEQVQSFAGISQSTLSELERGKISPKTIGAIAALARELETTADYLLGLTDDPTPYPRRFLPEYGPGLIEILRALSPTRAEELYRIARIFEDTERRRGVHFSAHALRRTFAINSLRNGMDIYTLARLMGHSDITVLRAYLPFVTADLQAAQEKFGVVDNLLY